MLVRIYADDARRIADAYDLKDVVETEKATWAEPEIRYGLTADVTLVKVRTGGTTHRRLHHYFILAKGTAEAYALSLIQEHCNKSRCYYTMPEFTSASLNCEKR